HRELTEEERSKYDEIRQAKLEKLSPEGKTAAKQIHVIRQANKGDRKAVKEAIDKVLDSLSESVREELK
ncbi:hypothetical protein PFISCL1PPCAC_25338, partial [Pristionchus fissidentatus]